MPYFFMLLCLISALSAELVTINPPALQKGDLVAIVFPASFLDKRHESQQILEKKRKWLEMRGYRTICYPSLSKPLGYLAGSDKERADALMDAWHNKEVKAIWCFRGGYGSCRILDLLDYEWIKAHPKILLGMSDITALHHAIQQKTGLATFLAPTLSYFDQNIADFNEKYCLSELENIIVKGLKEPFVLPKAGSEIEVLSAGAGRGKLVGGNLALVASLCGTKWQLDTKGKILVLEEVGEDIYRIDRMLWQLKEAGLLKSPAGVILGTWTHCKSTLQNSLSLREVFKHYFETATYPVILGFPTGHCSFQTTLPLNVEAELNTDQRRLTLLESAVSK